MNEWMADRARGLPGCVLPDEAHRRIVLGDGLRLAKELARELAGIAAVDALHIYPLGAESATRDIAAAFRTARGAPCTATNTGRSLRRGTAVRPPRANVRAIRPLDWRAGREDPGFRIRLVRRDCSGAMRKRRAT